MCGRASLTASGDDLREVFGLAETPAVAPHYNVPPSQPLHVVRVTRDGVRRRMDALRWGLVPSWATDPKIGHRLTLARVESVQTTPAFRDAVRRRRCLVAVDGFFEWRRDPTTASGTRRSRKGAAPSVPFFVRRPDRGVFALAGVWERWTSPDGEVVESCAILTQPAREPVSGIHDRMPLVLAPSAWGAWLDRGRTDPDAIAALLAQPTPELFAYAVTPHVNDPRHDDAGCLEAAVPEAAPPNGGVSSGA
jgi:putative SOS response-associated peptidase YedK